MLTNISVIVHCFNANIQGHHIVAYRPQQTLQVHDVIILLLSFENEHPWSDCHKKFMNYMQININCASEDMKKVISDACRQNARRKNTRWHPKFSGLVPPSIQQLW